MQKCFNIDYDLYILYLNKLNMISFYSIHVLSQFYILLVMNIINYGNQLHFEIQRRNDLRKTLL